MDPLQQLSNCPDGFPKMEGLIRDLGRAWAGCPERPRINAEVLSHWDALVEEWADNAALALVIRKSTGVRGSTIEHAQSKRKLVVADNSPAHWVFSQAFIGKKPKLDEIVEMFAADRIPFSYATKAAEKTEREYKCKLALCDNVNKRKWKLCHIDQVGLRTRTPIAEISLERLRKHFISLMSPSNLFLVPKRWAGLGEVPEFIEEVRRFEQNPKG